MRDRDGHPKNLFNVFFQIFPPSTSREQHIRRRAFLILVVLAFIFVYAYREYGPEIIERAEQAGKPTVVPHVEVKIDHNGGTKDRWLIAPPLTTFTFVKSGGGNAILTVNAQIVAFEVKSTDKVCVSSQAVPNWVNAQSGTDGFSCFTAANAQ